MAVNKLARRPDIRQAKAGGLDVSAQSLTWGSVWSEELKTLHCIEMQQFPPQEPQVGTCQFNHKPDWSTWSAMRQTISPIAQPFSIKSDLSTNGQSTITMWNVCTSGMDGHLHVSEVNGHLYVRVCGRPMWDNMAYQPHLSLVTFRPFRVTQHAGDSHVNKSVCHGDQAISYEVQGPDITVGYSSIS